MDYLYQQETEEIIGAFYEVYNTLGGGFLEYVYQDALAIEFEKRSIPYEKESLIKIYYKGVALKHYYQADFVCFGNIIVETKALRCLTEENYPQVLNYLKATNHKLALLVNFGHTKIEFKRIINTHYRNI